MEALIESIFGPAAGEALRIAMCESGPDLHAEPSENWYHRGPFQISYVHAGRYAARGWVWETASDAQHVEIAHELYLEQGWAPWRFSASCHGVY